MELEGDARNKKLEMKGSEGAWTEILNRMFCCSLFERFKWMSSVGGGGTSRPPLVLSLTTSWSWAGYSCFLAAAMMHFPWADRSILNWNSFALSFVWLNGIYSRLSASSTTLLCDLQHFWISMLGSFRRLLEPNVLHLLGLSCNVVARLERIGVHYQAVERAYVGSKARPGAKSFWFASNDSSAAGYYVVRNFENIWKPQPLNGSKNWVDIAGYLGVESSNQPLATANPRFAQTCRNPFCSKLPGQLALLSYWFGFGGNEAGWVLIPTWFL